MDIAKLKAATEAWRFNVALECSGASLCAIDEIAIGGAVLKLDTLLPILEFASQAFDQIEALQREVEEARFTADDMAGYAWNGYCAGWKAAVQCLADPGSLPAQHGQRWMHRPDFPANPPAMKGEG